MRIPSNVFLSAALLGPSPQELNAYLDRWIGMGTMAQVEDRSTTQLGRWPGPAQSDQILRPIAESLERPREISVDQRAEWAIRVGWDKAQLTLGDLANVKDADLVDAALWQWLRARAPDPIDVNVAWKSIRRDLGEFFASYPLSRLKQKLHAPWWRWIVYPGTLPTEAERTKAEGDFAVLIALDFVQRAETSSGPQQLRQVLLARHYLSRDVIGQLSLKSFESRVAASLEKSYGRKRAIGRDLFELNIFADYERLLDQKIAVLGALSDHWTRRSEFRLAADCRALQVLLLLEADRNVPASTLIDLAEYEIEVTQYDMAISFARTALEHPKLDLILNNRAQTALALATEGLASKKNSHQDLEWAAEYYRRALAEGLHSENRDLLLESYGRVLSRLEYRRQAIDVFESLFRTGISNNNRLRGLGFATDQWPVVIRRAHIEDQRRMVEHYLNNLLTLARALPRSTEAKKHYAQARVVVKDTGLDEDPTTQATLVEIQRSL